MRNDFQLALLEAANARLERENDRLRRLHHDELGADAFELLAALDVGDSLRVRVAASMLRERLLGDE